MSNKRISYNKLARNTNLHYASTAFNKLHSKQPLKLTEFLEICNFLKINPAIAIQNINNFYYK